jgi:hypothetical protein
VFINDARPLKAGLLNVAVVVVVGLVIEVDVEVVVVVVVVGAVAAVPPALPATNRTVASVIG